MLIIFILSSLAALAHTPPSSGHEYLSFKQGDLHMHYQFESKPEVMKEAVLVLQAMDPRTHSPVALAEVLEVSLYMPKHDHGSAPTEIEAVAPGQYRVTNIHFTMGGLWEMRVDLKTPAGELVERQSFEVQLDGGHNHGHHRH